MIVKRRRAVNKENTHGQNKVQVGDRFTTVGGYPTIWTIEREIHGPTVTPHFQLSQEGQPSRVETLSGSVFSTPTSIGS